jgi:RNA polymerase sigma factor (sigma-70 family)
MVVDPFGRAVTRLGRLVGDGTESLTDADLLRRFVSGRDGIAFAAIVRRHGPMVFGVCRRTLGNIHDAEDAFQATFVVLARRASVVKPDGISRWLYGVAVRVANKARGRRIRHGNSSVGLDTLAARPEREPADWLPKLDAALARLSDRDRRPILLCDLAGHSRAEAAAELGIAEGTLSSRLARAREKLRRKLGRLGVSLSAAHLAAGLVSDATATVPASLIESTRAVSTIVPVHELAEGVVRGMALANFTKWSAIGLCLMGTLTAGAIWLPTAGADPQAGGKDATKSGLQAKSAAEPKTDAERIRGTWIVESRKASVEPRPRKGPGFGGGNPNGWDGLPITFDGDRVDCSGFPGWTNYFRLESTRDPKAIDFTFRGVVVGGRQKDLTQLSIYRFEGDKLRIVLGDVDLVERPESFEWSDKTPFVHLVLRRPTDNEQEGLLRDELDTLQGTWVAVRKTIEGEVASVVGVKLVVKGDRLRFDVPPAESLHATFEVNTVASPWEIGLKATSDGGGLKKGQILYGIFSRQGGRQGAMLMLSLAPTAGGKGPKSFEEAGKNGIVYVFGREGINSGAWSDLVGRDGPKSPKKETPKVDNSRLRKLQEARIEALKTQLQGQFERVKIGKDPLITLLDLLHELKDAELEIASSVEAKVEIVARVLKQLQVTEEQLIELQEAGLQTKEGVAQAKAARLKVEIELEKLKAAK